jgi:hypothetical protein
VDFRQLFMLAALLPFSVRDMLHTRPGPCLDAVQIVFYGRYPVNEVQ